MIVCYLRDGDRVFETYWATGRATEAMGSVYGLLDMTVYGRQEIFEDSPPGWPQFWRNTGEQWRINGRPTPQWERARGRALRRPRRQRLVTCPSANSIWRVVLTEAASC